jgi:hypothetical protein
MLGLPLPRLAFRTRWTGSQRAGSDAAIRSLTLRPEFDLIDRERGHRPQYHCGTNGAKCLLPVDAEHIMGELGIEGKRVKIVRFIPTPDGGSQFIEADIPIDNLSTDAFRHPIRRSGVLPAQSVMLTEMPEGLNQDWHPASRRQLIVVLSGTVEVETSDGSQKRWSSGEMFLADDFGSRGHRTRTLGGPARVLFVHLPPDLTLGA